VYEACTRIEIKEVGFIYVKLLIKHRKNGLNKLDKQRIYCLLFYPGSTWNVLQLQRVNYVLVRLLSDSHEQSKGGSFQSRSTLISVRAIKVFKRMYLKSYPLELVLLIQRDPKHYRF